MSYRKQASDVQLAVLERIASHVDVVDAIAAAGANFGALVSAAEADLASRLVPSTGRTTVLPSARRTEVGALPVARTFGRGTEADHYSMLDGAPVGAPESLVAARLEARAARNDAAWERTHERAATYDARMEAESQRRKRGGAKARRAAARAGR